MLEQENNTKKEYTTKEMLSVFKLNEKAEIKDQWFGRTVTYSDARFAYEEAQAVIENNTDFVISNKTEISSIKTEIPEDVSLTGKTYNTQPEIAEAESFTIMQGYLENSNVSAIEEMIGLIEVSRAHEANQKMIQTFDQNIGKAIGTLGQTS